MNEIERIAALAAKADSSAEPPIPDLADRVLADIRRGTHGGADGSRRVWQATAAAVVVFAVIAAATAARSWSSLVNPLADLGDSPTSVEMR
jgi:hypothetical protein